MEREKCHTRNSHASFYIEIFIACRHFSCGVFGIEGYTVHTQHFIHLHMSNINFSFAGFEIAQKYTRTHHRCLGDYLRNRWVLRIRLVSLSRSYIVVHEICQETYALRHSHTALDTLTLLEYINARHRVNAGFSNMKRTVLSVRVFMYTPDANRRRIPLPKTPPFTSLMLFSHVNAPQTLGKSNRISNLCVFVVFFFRSSFAAFFKAPNKVFTHFPLSRRFAKLLTARISQTYLRSI